MVSGRGLLRERITKETPMTFDLLKTYEFNNLKYVLLATATGIFFVRKPSDGERLRDFPKSTLIILPNYDFYIVLDRVNELEEGERIAEFLLDTSTERSREMNG